MMNFYYMVGLMVKALSDLSDLDVGTVQKMIAVDNLCAESGIGSHYGQLVMLGYKVGDISHIICSLSSSPYNRKTMICTGICSKEEREYFSGISQ